MKSTLVGFWFLAPLLVSVTGVHSQTKTPTTASDLAGTSWQLVKFQGSDGTTLRPDDKGKYTITFEADGHVSARIDCNRGRGTWKSAGSSQLEFDSLALTRAFCPSGSLQDQIAKQWQNVRSYTLKDGHLFLALMADGGIYEYEPLSPPGSTGGVVKGTAAYRERMALPSTAVFEATLEDISKADAPAEVLGRVRTEEPGDPPIHFEIPYDASRIDPSHRYAVRARILVDNKLLFTTDRQYPVLTEGYGNGVELMLQRVSASGTAAGEIAGTGTPPGPPTSAAHLENTYWRLIRLEDQPVTGISKEREPYFILNSETGRVSGSGGCNRMTGSYKLDRDHLSFSQMASTMMACIKGMDTEKEFLKALNEVSKWKITGQHLQLSNASGNMVAILEARPNMK